MIDHPPKICQACVHSAVTGNWGWLADEEHWPFFTQAVRDMLEYAHLDEAEASLAEVGESVLDLESAVSAITLTRSALERFMAACRKAEDGDADGHNNLMTEVHDQLSEAPVTLMETLDINVWLRQNLSEYLDPALSSLEKTQQALSPS